MGAGVTEAQARARCSRIKLLLESMTEQREKVLTLITEAQESGDHLALGYPSWTAYVSAEYAGLLAKLTREDRREAVLTLTETGMSTRAIASVIGASKSQVQRDISGVPNGTPENVWANTDVTDEQFETALTQARAEGDLSAENVVKIAKDISKKSISTNVIGIDGKRYTKPAEPRKPRNRRPLPDAYRTAVYDLERVVDRLERLHQDDRFDRNREVVRGYTRGTLFRCQTKLRRMITDLGGEPTLPVDGGS